MTKVANSDLVICKLSHCAAPAIGNIDMVLLCEKVSKEDIQVRFFEENNGLVVWEAFGEFQPSHVHKQVAISFRTPSYKFPDTSNEVKAYIQLRRPSDGATSEALPFTFTPTCGRPGHHLLSLRKALARKKAICDLNRVLASESYLPSRSRILDDFNNNDDLNDIDVLNARRAYNKLVALRALNDIYNIQQTHLENRNYQVPPKSSIFSSARELDNNNVETICDDDKTIVPETNGSVRDDNANGNVADIETRTEQFNYNQVGKWVEKNQETSRDILEESNNELINESINNSDKEFNDLIKDVVELDRIYEDTHTKLLQERQQNKDHNMELDVQDNQTYTSLQMAMKNPIWVRARKPDENLPVPTCQQSPIIAINPDVPPPRPPPLVARIKRDVTQDSEEHLPPLPPKRIRKTPSMPVLARHNSQIFTEKEQAPQKHLPTVPSSTLPKQNKPGLFSKLFSKKSKKENANSLSSTNSLPGFEKNNPQVTADKLPPTGAFATSTKSLELIDGNVTPPYGADLTEAEHYALYTAMAPHATASEFDEMSFYYSPVEGGKILAEGKQAV
ncbi:embryonic polarity protein dorsal-like isoform X3 [Phymastichus coffea]|uniref:embryonic polarity protein dorsal-like isoform X3 n=1 Tax=Phymastichus coffea TaxID=108790 RepID=UPI00273A86BD|nr:embryonic polarity protein dorsal-like isoform X3 [Phymastichus coffea]